MRAALLRLPLVVLVVVGVVLEAALLFAWWPAGVAAGALGAAVYAAVVGAGLQREAARAPRAELADLLPLATPAPAAAPATEPVALRPVAA